MSDAIKGVKISTVKAEKTCAETNVDTGKTSAAASDTYTSSIASDYAQLVAGQAKQANAEAVQDILEGMGAGLFGTIASAEHYTPDVPDLYNDILKDVPATELNMKPIIKRYSVLEKTIIAQILENKNALKQHWKLEAGQIQDLNRNVMQLERKLNHCREQLKLAQNYYTWEQNNKAASKAEES